MSTVLSDEQVERIRELLAVMSQRRDVIGATTPGDKERTTAWLEYDKARRELEEILPPATGPLS